MKKYAVKQVNTEITYRGFKEHKDIYENADDGMFLNYSEDYDTFDVDEKYFDSPDEALAALAKRESSICDSSSCADRFVMVREFFAEEIIFDDDGDEVEWNIIEFAKGLKESASEWIKERESDE